MRISPVLHIIGLILLYIGGAMFLPLGFSVYYKDGASLSILLSLVVTVFFGLIFFKFTSAKGILRTKEGFGIVTFGWIFIVLFGMLPFLFSGSITSFTDAFFESMSGFTTTGATILTDIESVPEGILLWRAMTQWIGGMGIIVFSLAILPYLGVGGMQLFKAEVPGPTPDRLKPRIKETAKTLWMVYLILSISETVLLMVGGATLFDAICHTFTTLATGGFSTHTESIGYFNSIYIDMVIIFFMFCAGTNFSLHYHGLRGNIKEYFKNKEFKIYVLITFTAVLIIAIDIYSHYGSIGETLRFSSFQAVSIGTTTGYGTADYEQWSHLSQFVLFMLMFIGGCAGSTGGGAKVIRFMILIKQSIVEMKKIIHPMAIFSTRLDKKSISTDIITNVLVFLLIFVGSFVIASIIMMALGLDMISAFGSVAASLGNIGPGLGMVGPSDNYASIPVVGKWVLSFCMLLGRLEFYTVLVVLQKDFWKN